MQIHYKSITHERFEDAPFTGALISSIDCKFGCKGCINNHLKRAPTFKDTAENIISNIKENPFNEGIILGGLEWSLQPLEMIELCRVAQENNLQIMIYTGCELNEFYRRIGQAVVDSVNYSDYVDKASLGNSAPVVDLIGRITLDNAIPEDYYIKTGVYIKDQKTTENNPFGVHLASRNQNIYLIKGE